MSVVTRTTQPMSVPWAAARNQRPARILVTLDRRVSLVVEDELRPVADLHARVFAIELVALLTLEDVAGNILEQRRVRAHGSDGSRFAAVVMEQVELACHLCPGIEVAVTRDADRVWDALRVALSALAVEGSQVLVAEVVDRPPLTAEDLELMRRARRRPALATGTEPPPLGARAG